MQVSRIPTFGLIVDHTSKVLDAKLCFISVFRWNVVGVEFMLRVEFVQHGGVCTLRCEKETFSMSTGYSMWTYSTSQQSLLPWGTCSPRR